MTPNSTASAVARDNGPRQPHFVVQPSHGWVSLNLHELWEFRELLYFFTWRDIKVRYKQTVLGASWAIIQPLLTMAIFSLFFGRLAKMPSDGIAYPLFCLAGLVPWTFFANAMTQSANSMVGNANLVSKVYFPRFAIPVASALASVVDVSVSFLVLLAMMLAYGVVPELRALWVPALLLLALATSIGAGLWLCALNVQYRDVRHTLPFLAQVWLFATPIAYPSSLVPEPWRILFALNPMVGVVEGFRWSLLGARGASASMLVTSSLVAAVLLISGAFYFKRVERRFADII